MKKLKKLNFIFFIKTTLNSANKGFLLCALLCFFNVLYCQSDKPLKIPDSLQNKTYKELYASYNLNYSDTIKAGILAKAYLYKAKNENDTIKIANGYSQLVSIYRNSKSNLSILYCDSIIKLTKNLNDFEYPGFGYLSKGIWYNYKGEYKKALDNLLIANEYASKNKNYNQLFYLKNVIGDLKLFWGNNDEALEIFKSQLNLIKQGNFNFEYENNLHLNIYFRISNSYILNKKLDSALIFTKKGIQSSLAIKDTLTYYDFVSQSGIIAYFKNDLEMALDSLEKAFPYESSENGFLNNHYYRANIYLKQNENKKAYYHFSKADSIYNVTNDVVPEVRGIQEYFVNFYKSKNDTKNQLKYINRLLKIDSIILSNHRNLNATIVKKYDTPLLLAEKQNIISKLKKQEKNSSLIILVLIGVVIFGVGLIGRFYYNQRVYKKRFKKLLSEQNKENEIKIQVDTNSNEIIGISKERIDAVIVGLESFEKNHDFLDNKITLNTLSLSLNTNSTYLSKIINLYKKKNFSSYITELRINYCIEKLQKDQIFRKYTVKAIAYEIGFNNVESFSKAFFKKTGIHPSFYIKEIESQN